MQNIKPEPLAAMNYKQLCKHYKVSFKTLKKRLANVPGLVLQPHQHLIFPNDLEKIFNHIR